MAGGGMDGRMAGMPMPPPSPPSSSTPMAMAPPGAPQKRMGGMHMTFFWGKDVQVLFYGWPGRRRGVGQYLLALFFVFALSVLVESLSYAAARLASLSHRRAGADTVHSATSSPSPSISAVTAQTAVHAIRVGLAYVVMLAVMSFNVGVLIAAVAGHALGFFLFRSGALGWGATDGPAGEAAHARANRPNSEDK